MTHHPIHHHYGGWTGSYESFALLGAPEDPQRIVESTRQREAYFLEFAKDLRAVVNKTPLMVTGG